MRGNEIAMTGGQPINLLTAGFSRIKLFCNSRPPRGLVRGVSHETKSQKGPVHISGRCRLSLRRRIRYLPGLLQASYPVILGHGKAGRPHGDRRGEDRRARHPPYFREKRKRPLLRPGLHHRPRADVPDGPDTAGRQGRALDTARRRDRGDRQVFQDHGLLPRRRGRVRGHGPPDQIDRRRVHPRGQRLYQHRQAPPQRVRHTRRKARALEARGQPGGRGFDVLPPERAAGAQGHPVPDQRKGGRRNP